MLILTMNSKKKEVLAMGSLTATHCYAVTRLLSQGLKPLERSRVPLQ